MIVPAGAALANRRLQLLGHSAGPDGALEEVTDLRASRYEVIAAPAGTTFRRMRLAMAPSLVAPVNTRSVDATRRLANARTSVFSINETFLVHLNYLPFPE